MKSLGFHRPVLVAFMFRKSLNILENFQLKQLYENDPAVMYHVVAEAMKLAFADRAHWLGDPDFVNVPIGLIDKQYAKQLGGLD